MRGQREQEKRAKEVADCCLIAAAINRRDETDYEPVSSEKEPADVILRSRSGRYPDRPVQVVTVPADTEEDRNAHEIRNDNKMVAGLKDQIGRAIAEAGLSGAQIAVLIRPAAAQARMPDAPIKALAAEVKRVSAGIADGGQADIDFPAIFAIDPEICVFITRIVIWRDASIDGVAVDTPGLASALPSDGRWIWSGIEKKVAKYGDAAKDLILAVRSESLVEEGQIGSFMAQHPAGSMPFEEVWIDCALGAVCLQPPVRRSSESSAGRPLSKAPAKTW